jgi:hypothetical protein
MDSALHQRIDVAVGEFQATVHQRASKIDPTAPGVLLDLERTLFAGLMKLGTALVLAFLEAFHRRTEWVKGCQERAKTPGQRLLGWRCTRVYDLFGGRQRVRTPYVGVDRRHQPGRRRKPGRRGPSGSGGYPVLATLGCRVNATPALLGEAASQLAWGPTEKAALSRLSARGIRLDNSTLRRMVYTLADQAQATRTAALQAGRLPPGVEGESLAGKRAVICFDAGRVRTRTRRRGRRRKNRYRGFDRPWRAPRLLVIYPIDEKGQPQRSALPLYEGVLTSAQELFTLMQAYLAALHASEAQLLIFLANGAVEHWQRVADLQAGLGLDPTRVVEVLDWAHAVEHLATAAEACATWTSQERSRWLKKQRQRLRQGQLAAVLDALQRLCRGRRAPTLRREIAFFQQHAGRMRYDAFRKAGIPIGSGAVESGLRRVVNLRMKGPSIFWIPENVQRMLYLRCQLLSGRWETFLRALLCPGREANRVPTEETSSL